MNNDAFESTLIDSITRSLTKNSMIASSIATKIMSDRKLVDQIIQGMDYDKVAEVMAQELLRMSTTHNGSHITSYSPFMSAVQTKLVERLEAKMEAQMMDDVRTI
jgi:hypothetical protein